MFFAAGVRYLRRNLYTAPTTCRPSWRPARVSNMLARQHYWRPLAGIELATLSSSGQHGTHSTAEHDGEEILCGRKMWKDE